MKRIALVYATRYGQTRKIVERLEVELQSLGAETTVYGDCEHYPRTLVGYDMVVLGGPVYVGELPVEIQKWALVHAEELDLKDLALFSVSLNAADARPRARAADRAILERFCVRTGLKPRLTRSLKGALPYTRYGFFKRWLLRRISGAAGGPTDTSKDHEMTDWNEVAAFARDCFGQTLAGEDAAPVGDAKATV